MNKTEIEFSKYKERGACHIKETSHSIKYFNAYQQARFDLILKYLGDIRGKVLVDVGCGDGALTFLFCKAGAEVIGVDPEELGIKFAEEYLTSKGFNPKLIVASGYETTLPENSADCVVMSDVIEHVQDDERLLVEARRILKPGGKLIISTPYRLTEKPVDKFHVKEYFPGEIKAVVSKYFTEVEVKETHDAFWHTMYCHEIGIPKLRRILRYLINISSVYFKKNPFMRDASQRKKWDFFTQLFVIAKK